MFWQESIGSDMWVIFKCHGPVRKDKYKCQGSVRKDKSHGPVRKDKSHGPVRKWWCGTCCHLLVEFILSCEVDGSECVVLIISQHDRSNNSLAGEHLNQTAVSH